MVAEVEGSIVGSIDVLAIPTLTHGGSTSAFVQNVVVDGAYRRTGIGRALFDHLERYAREHGYYKIEFLSANTRPDAHGFYRAFGFDGTAQGFRKYL